MTAAARAWTETDPRPASAADDWRDLAACAGTDPGLFYPETGDVVTAARARALCRQCPAADACLDHALTTNEQHGIWGGLGERERRPLRVARRDARTATP